MNCWFQGGEGRRNSRNSRIFFAHNDTSDNMNLNLDVMMEELLGRINLDLY